jgi:hypothetical protein
VFFPRAPVFVTVTFLRETLHLRAAAMLILCERADGQSHRCQHGSY